LLAHSTGLIDISRRPSITATLSRRKLTAMLAAIAVVLRLKFNLFQLGTQHDTSPATAFRIRRKSSEHRARHDPPSPDTFPSFLNEVRQRNRK
jgi:hypothetical protein